MKDMTRCGNCGHSMEIAHIEGQGCSVVGCLCRDTTGTGQWGRVSMGLNITPVTRP